MSLAGSASSNPQTLGERILWDANALDALGAVRLARAFIKGGHEGQTIDETIMVIEEDMKRPLLTNEGKSGLRPGYSE